jgi:hypothetical protein
MRRLLFLVPLLASCTSRPAVENEGAATPAAGEADTMIECRGAGETAFAPTCTVERADSPDGRILTIRKADGGFRRLRMTNDGTGVAAADGAEQAHVSLLPDRRIEVEIGGDRFRLPARVQAR